MFKSDFTEIAFNIIGFLFFLLLVAFIGFLILIAYTSITQECVPLVISSENLISIDDGKVYYINDDVLKVADAYRLSC